MQIGLHYMFNVIDTTLELKQGNPETNKTEATQQSKSETKNVCLLYKCKYCDNDLLNKNSLQSHIQQLHSNKQNIKHEPLDQKERGEKLNSEIMSRMNKGKDAEGAVSAEADQDPFLRLL